MGNKVTAAKFWVGLVSALLGTVALVGLPGWWGKGVGIAISLLGTAGVYLTTNKPLQDTPPAAPEVHNG